MDEPLFNELLESVKQADQIMTDHAELRRLAERADALYGMPSLGHEYAISKFRVASTPKTILAMLDEIDGLLAQHGRDSSELRALCQARDDARKERDRLKAENERLLDELSACTEHPGGCGYWREAAKRRAEERDRLKAENEALRKFSAEAYQVLGALDAPENVLDNASDAANGVPLRHETLLPFFAEDYEALRKDAARYRWVIASAWYVGPEPKGDTEAVSWHDHNDTMHGVTTAIDAAIEGAKQ
ncbi:hypothetical protein [Pseudomonas aeruginosa]